jgi:hypothetical protein
MQAWMMNPRALPPKVKAFCPPPPCKYSIFGLFFFKKIIIYSLKDENLKNNNIQSS